MRLNSKRREKFLIVLFCLLASFICLMLNSNISPLYAFDVHTDVHYFSTTARCMLRGDVLYRDIYEHKGPILYFLYAIGLLLSSDTYYGVFAVEVCMFTIYLYFAYQTAALYLKNRAALLSVTAATGMISSCVSSFAKGAQCEELALPLLMIPIYLCLKYLRQEYPAKIRLRYVLTIGVCFALVFWMKYTMAGLFGGLVLFVLFLQLRDKKIKQLFCYIGQFLAGFLLGSVPVILYFAIYRAFDSLFQVYFYNLIFIYGGDQPANNLLSFLTTDFYSKYLGYFIPSIIWIVCAFWSGKRIFSREEKLAAASMIFWASFGICLHTAGDYTMEYLCVFTVLGLTALMAALRECCTKHGEIARTIGKFHSFLHDGRKFYPDVLLLMLLLVVLYRSFFPLCMELLLSVLLVRGWNILAVKHKWVSIAGYVFLILAVVGCLLLEPDYDFLRAAAAFTILWKVPDTLYVHREPIAQYFRREVPKWQSEYREQKGLCNALLGIGLTIVCVLIIMNCSANTENLGKPIEEYPQYTMAQYILENGGDDPIILYLDIPDPGIYWLTGTYPPEKYFGNYNIDLPEKTEMYEAYEKNKKADYVICENELDWTGYQFVYEGETDYGDYYLYEKIKS